MNCWDQTQKWTRGKYCIASAVHRALNQICTADILGHFQRINREPTGVRQAWARLANLVAILRGSEHFNAAKLARAAKCSTKTIQRDIAHLRGQGVKISFDFTSGTYRLEKNQPVPWWAELSEEATT